MPALWTPIASRHGQGWSMAGARRRGGLRITQAWRDGEKTSPLAAVGRHMSNVRVLCEEGRKVVGYLFFDCRVQAAGPYARLKRIPERDTDRLKDRYPFLIGQRRTSTEQLTHDVPECIPRMRVILAGFQ